MTIVFIVLSIAASFLLDWLLSLWVPISFFLVPIAPIVAIFWLQKLNFSGRLILAICMGWICDAVSLVPFGTNLILFTILACVLQPIRTSFRYQPTPLSQFFFTIGLSLMYFILLPVFQHMLSFLTGGR